jgi:hypothetical protein
VTAEAVVAIEFESISNNDCGNYEVQEFMPI